MQKSIFKKLFSDQRGATVMIAMGISIMIIGFSFAIATISRDTGRDIIAFKDSSQSKLLAESTNEELLLATKEKEAGFNARGAACDTLISGSSAGNIYCNVEGRASKPINQWSEDWYVVPNPGTGDAADGRECLDATDLNDPCYWGRLGLGNIVSNSVVVPLYYQIDTSGGDCIDSNFDDDGDGICNPLETGLSKLKIRIRTSCVDGSKTKDCPRHVLNSGSTYETDQTVVNWEVKALCDDKLCSLAPRNVTKQAIGLTLRDPDLNSEIHESLINTRVTEFNEDQYVLFEGNSDTYFDGQAKRNKQGKVSGIDSVEYQTLYQFLRQIIIKKPVLQLTLVTRTLETDAGSKLPYLEYQILSDKPISNFAQNFNIQVDYKGQSYEIETEQKQKKDVIDFAIQN